MLVGTGGRLLMSISGGGGGMKSGGGVGGAAKFGTPLAFVGPPLGLGGPFAADCSRSF